MGSEDADKSERHRRPFLPNPFVDSESLESPRHDVTTDPLGENKTLSISATPIHCSEGPLGKIAEVQNETCLFLPNPFISPDSSRAGFSAETFSEISPQPGPAVLECEDVASRRLEIQSFDRVVAEQAERVPNSLQNQRNRQMFLKFVDYLHNEISARQVFFRHNSLPQFLLHAG